MRLLGLAGVTTLIVNPARTGRSQLRVIRVACSRPRFVYLEHFSIVSTIVILC